MESQQIQRLSAGRQGVHPKRPILAIGNSKFGCGVFGEPMQKKLKAPFPYFGGKNRVARRIWDGIGDVDNAIEPFCGSAAWLLARPIRLASKPSTTPIATLPTSGAPPVKT